MEWSEFFAASPDEREAWLVDPERTEEELTSTLERMVPRPRPGTNAEQTRLFGAILGNPNATFDTLFAFLAAFGADYGERCEELYLLLELFFANMALPFLLLQGEHERHLGLRTMLMSPGIFCLPEPHTLLEHDDLERTRGWVVPVLTQLEEALGRLEQGDEALLDDVASIANEARSNEGDAWADEEMWMTAILDPLSALLGDYGLEGATTYLLFHRSAFETARGSSAAVGLAPRFWDFCATYGIAPLGRR